MKNNPKLIRKKTLARMLAGKPVRKTTLDFICADTEDDSVECLATHGDGRRKQVTQIAAMGTHGQRFHNRGNTKEFLVWLRQAAEELKAE